MKTKTFLKHTNLTKVYFIVYTILALWAILAFITVHGIIDKQEHFAELLNVSGKQRMYSQRTQLYATRYSYSKKQEDLATLKLLLNEMQSDHKYLLFNIPSEIIKQYYYKEPNLVQKVSHYFSSIESFLIHPNQKALLDLQDRSTQLLPMLNTMVILYEEESNKTIQTLKKREWYILFGTLLTLSLTYIFLVRPVNKLIKTNEKALTYSLNQKEKVLAERLLFIDTLFDNTPLPLFFKDIDGKYQKVNEAFCRSFGFSEDTIIGKDAFDIAPKELAKIYHEQDEKLYQSPRMQQIYEAKVFNHEQAKHVDVRFYKQVLFNHKNKPIGFIGAVLDISETKAQLNQLNQINKELNEISNKDQLTGIPNRRFLERILFQINNRTFIHTCNSLCVLMIDIDDFKAINDTFGHTIGDEVLQQFVQRSLQAIRRNDILGRWGGEEFLVLCANNTQEQGLIVANKICDSLRASSIKAINKPITVSIGVADTIIGNESLESVIERADEALYYAKQQGKDQAKSYGDIPHAKAIQEL